MPEQARPVERRRATRFGSCQSQSLITRREVTFRFFLSLGFGKVLPPSLTLGGEPRPACAPVASCSAAFAKPFRGFGIVFANSVAIVVHKTKITLGSREPLVSDLAVPLLRPDSAAIMVHDTKMLRSVVIGFELTPLPVSARQGLPARPL